MAKRIIILLVLVAAGAGGYWYWRTAAAAEANGRILVSGNLEMTQVDISFKASGKLLADEKSDRLYIADTNHNRIVVANLDGKLVETIGSGQIGSADGSYQKAAFDHPQGLALTEHVAADPLHRRQFSRYGHRTFRQRQQHVVAHDAKFGAIQRRRGLRAVRTM